MYPTAESAGGQSTGTDRESVIKMKDLTEPYRSIPYHTTQRTGSGSGSSEGYKLYVMPVT